jgi:formylmethanofuran--tetrahydromethanopterin N-formyltransferase
LTPIPRFSLTLEECMTSEKSRLNESLPPIIDTFAEAFDMKFTRLIITAWDEYWLESALREFCGYGSSVIACDAEVAVERRLSLSETPDARPGAEVLAFSFSKSALSKAIPQRVGQCLMTCPTTAVFNGLPGADHVIPLGKSLRYFGDGFQKSKQIEGERYWRVPVMDGEFWVAHELGVDSGIGGGNLIIQAENLESGLDAARRIVASLEALPGMITPFPGGVARSGSKVGSRYKGLVASTADAYCPTLKGRTDSLLLGRTNVTLEVVIDGVSRAAIEEAMKVAIQTASECSLLAIGAGNYGGKLGAHHFQLSELADRSVTTLAELGDSHT